MFTVTNDWPHYYVHRDGKYFAMLESEHDAQLVAGILNADRQLIWNAFMNGLINDEMIESIAIVTREVSDEVKKNYPN